MNVLTHVNPASVASPAAAVRRVVIALGAVALVLGMAVAFGHPDAGGAVPRIPTDPSEILEYATGGVGDSAGRERAALRRKLDRDPRDLALAVALAKLDIEASRREGDPRFLGRAQAALTPWWNEPSPPSDVLLLRATIRQSLHDFGSATADLDLLLAKSPNNVQAWLTRSVVLGVRGEYAAARESCAPLSALAGELVANACTAPIESLTGHAREAYDRLALTLDRTRREGERGWLLSILGEIAIRMGDDGAAERHLTRALEATPSEAYTQAALADLLLDLRRPLEVVGRLRGHENDDNLLLRLVIAELAVKDAAAAAHAEMLASKHAASRERGDVVHRREQARFELEVRRNPHAALELARANWEVQKEPADARVFLESALAARDPRAASPVVEFLTANRTEEPRLVALVARARAGSP